jgi:hypothetical protein
MDIRTRHPIAIEHDGRKVTGSYYIYERSIFVDNGGQKYTWVRHPEDDNSCLARILLHELAREGKA